MYVSLLLFQYNISNASQIWGLAYKSGDASPTPYMINSILTPEHEIPLDHAYSSAHLSQMHHHSMSLLRFPTIHWPHAQDHPFVYIGIYAAICLGSAFVNITGVVTQYTGALRASRVLFKRLLLTVVRATMRWHDVTPQGERFVKILDVLS